MVFRCAEAGGGCGAVWTPVLGNRRPVLSDALPWAWCPDCQVSDD